MRTLLFVIVLLVAGVNFTQAQRMLPGQKGLEVNAGVLPDGHPDRNYYVNAGMTVNGKGGNYRVVSLEYNHQHYNYKGVAVPLECYILEGGFSFYLIGDASKNISLNAGITALAGYENINRGRKLLFDGAALENEDSFIYGAGGKLSLETYLSDRFVLLVQGRAKVLWGTSLEQFRLSAGLGLRFNF